MTMRTPSMVSDVSAIEVASTTLRRPCGRRRDRAVLHVGLERAEQRYDVDGRIGYPLAQLGFATADFSGPGQKHQDRTGVSAQSAV